MRYKKPSTSDWAQLKQTYLSDTVEEEEITINQLWKGWASLCYSLKSFMQSKCMFSQTFAARKAQFQIRTVMSYSKYLFKKYLQWQITNFWTWEMQDTHEV